MSNLIESILRADDGNDTPRMLALCEQGLREQPNAAVFLQAEDGIRDGDS